MDPSSTFGEWLRRRRRTLDLTQQELAHTVGCTVSTIRKIEIGERRASKQIAERLAEGLKIPPAERAAFVTLARATPYLDPASAPTVPAEPLPRTATALSSPTTTRPLPPFLDQAAALRDTPPLFVAREQELADLETALATARSGQGQILFVIGGAGRGKTMLVREFARRAQAAHDDLIVVSGYCNAHTGSGDPYLPFREVLTMLSGDVETRWAGGLISTEHARRLWEAMPLTLPALIEHAPDLVGSFVLGKGVRERAATLATPDAPWFRELVARESAEAGARVAQQPIFTQYTAALNAIAME